MLATAFVRVEQVREPRTQHTPATFEATHFTRLTVLSDVRPSEKKPRSKENYHGHEVYEDQDRQQEHKSKQ